MGSRSRSDVCFQGLSASALLIFVLGLAACGGGSGGPAVSPSTATSSGSSGGSTEEPTNTEATDESATLDILSDDPVEVLLDGKPIGKAPITNFKVVPGSHDITFVNEAKGNTTMAVTVGPNEAQTVKAPSQAAHIN